MRNQIKQAWKAWRTGLLVLFVVGVVGLIAAACGALLSLPFILIAEATGHHINEGAWMLWGCLAASPVYLGKTVQNFAEQLEKISKTGSL